MRLESGLSLFMDILGKADREYINEDKKVIKVEAKESDFKTAKSSKIESETEVKNREDTAEKKGIRYTGGTDDNNNEKSKKPHDEQEPTNK